MYTYINGAIKESIGKGKALMEKIPGARDLGIYFSPLATTANREIDGIVGELDYLYNDVVYNNPVNIRQKFYQFKRLAGKMADIENVVIAAMSRKDKDDEFINKLVHEICTEIDYPLPTPVASCLSQKYYHIYPFYNLICIPLLESEFLLHLPDIYHELGHPLLSLDNPKVEPFQNSLGYFNIEIKKHFEAEIQRRTLNQTTETDFDPIYIYKDSWLENWSSELFCDLYATYTLGPAYVWSNLHMCTKMSWDVYKIPTYQKTSHPPDEARMKTILIALELIGFKDDADLIRSKWEEFKKIIAAVKSDESEFAIAVPEVLLKSAAEHCLIGTKDIGSDIPTAATTHKVYTLLNEAWKQFWSNPEDFYNWEHKAYGEFKANL